MQQYILLNTAQVETALSVALDQVNYLQSELDLCRDTLKDCREHSFNTEQKVEELNDVIRTLTSEVKYYQDLARSSASLCDAYEKRLGEEANEIEQDWWKQENQDEEYIKEITGE